jgi:long-chain acyl-CoA synthetase
MTDERRRQNVTHRLTGPGSPFELVEANIEGIACRVFRRGPRTLADVYRKAEASARCLYLVTDHCQVTCDEILRGANALGRALTNRLGAQVGTRVGIILRNRPEWPIAFIAATSIGAVATAIHRQQAAAELIAALDLAQCSVVIADEHFARELLELGDRRPVIVARDFASKGPAPTNWIFFDTLDTTTAAGSRATVSIDPEQEALIAFTSGSSSRAKGVVLTHRGIVTGMMNIMLGGAMSGMQTDRRMLETDVATRAAQPSPLAGGRNAGDDQRIPGCRPDSSGHARIQRDRHSWLRVTCEPDQRDPGRCAWRHHRDRLWID